MKLAKSDFQSCCLVLEGAQDVQPLLRLTHLLTPRPVRHSVGAARTIIYVDALPAPGPPFAALLQRIAVVNAQYDKDALAVVSPPVRIRLTEVELSTQPPPATVVLPSIETTEPWRDGETFVAVEMMLERRIGSTVRPLRVIQVYTNPLAFFWRACHARTIAPTLLVTVPAPSMARKWGALERMLASSAGPLPKLWVRSALSTSPDGHRDALRKRTAPKATPLFPRRVAVLERWDTELGVVLGAAGLLRTAPLVTAFAPQPAGIAVVLDSVGGRGPDRRVSIGSDEDLLVPRPMLLVTEARLVGRRVVHPGSTVTSWEELGLRSADSEPIGLPPTPLASAIARVRSLAAELGLPRAMMDLPALEDEVSVVLSSSPAVGNPVSLTLLTPHSLGFLGFGDVHGQLVTEPWSRS